MDDAANLNPDPQSEDLVFLAAALKAMVRTYEAHRQREAVAALGQAYDEVVAGKADLAAVHELLSPRSLPAISIYPFDPPSREVFYEAWDAALELTAG